MSNEFITTHYCHFSSSEDLARHYYSRAIHVVRAYFLRQRSLFSRSSHLRSFALQVLPWHAYDRFAFEVAELQAIIIESMPIFPRIIWLVSCSNADTNSSCARTDVPGASVNIFQGR